MNAKFLKIVSILAVTGSLSLLARDRDDQAAVLRTLDGRVFYVTELVKADPNGLLFRHRSGIAKVTFDQLDEATRNEFNYDPAEADEFERVHRKPTPQTGNHSGGTVGVNQEPEMILEVTTTTRSRVPRLASPYYGDGCTLPFAYYPMAPWPNHWSRYQPAHILAHYPYRHWAQHDLLRCSGFLPWQRRGTYIRY